MSKNLIKFTLVVVSIYLLIQIYLIFGTWITGVVTMLFFLTLPFIVGYFVAFMIAPGLTKIGKWIRLKPSLVLTILILGIIGIIAFLGTVSVTKVYEQIVGIADAVIHASDINVQRINELTKQFGFDLTSQLDMTQTLQKIAQFFASHSAVISSVTTRMFSSVLATGSFLLFFILTLFYTIDSVEEKTKQRLSALKEKGHVDFANLVERTEKIFRLYFRGVFISMVFVAIGSSIGFWVLGLPNPIGLGIVCGLFNVIPLVGPYIGAFPAGFVALSHGWLPLLYVILVVLVVQQIEGNLVTPNVQGKFLNIQPLSIIIGIVVFGALFGVVGMIFAAPISATVKVTIEYIKLKRPLIKQWWNTIVHSA